MSEQKELKRVEELNASMLPYRGTKCVQATPMNRRDYNDLRGWTLPEDEDGDDEGYLVQYIDNQKANVEGFYGYISWSPKDVFERSYQIDKTYKDALTIKLNNIQLEIQELEEEIEGMRPRGILDIKLKLEEHKVLKLYEELLIAHIKIHEPMDSCATLCKESDD